MNLVYIFIGGGAGSLCRYFMSQLIKQKSESIFPLNILLINILGSFLIGIFFHLFYKFILPAKLRLFIMVGFLGGFTTFSTYSLETVNLFRNGQYKYALQYIFLSNCISFLLTICGMYSASILVNTIKGTG